MKLEIKNKGNSGERSGE